MMDIQLVYTISGNTMPTLVCRKLATAFNIANAEIGFNQFYKKSICSTAKVNPSVWQVVSEDK